MGYKNPHLSLFVLAGCLLLGAVALNRASRLEAVPLSKPLSEIPLQFLSWKGQRTEDLDEKIVGVLGVSEYLNRVYRNTAGTPVGLYVGYYKSQRQGESIHSPLNCLPGAGWLPVKKGVTTVPIAASTVDPSLATGVPIEINRYVIEKSGQSMLVLYWYQSHGRVVANEYWGKIYMVWDAIRTHRTDAALVRVIVPMTTGDGASEAEAERAGVEFVQSLFPLLRHYLQT
jgi:EpsI family protein